MSLVKTINLDTCIINLGFHGIYLKVDKHLSSNNTPYYDIYYTDKDDPIVLPDYTYTTVRDFLISWCTKLDLDLYQKMNKIMKDVQLVHSYNY